MVVTCGVYLYSTLQKAFLLCHATRSRMTMWSIPKGLPDENESCRDAAFRELYEETGIEVNTLHVLYESQLPAVRYKKQRKLLESFLVVTDTDLNDFSFRCRSMVDGKFPEVDKFRWVGFEEMEKLAHEAQIANLPLLKELTDTL